MILKKAAAACAALGIIYFTAFSVGAEPDWEAFENQQQSSTSSVTTSAPMTTTDDEESSVEYTTSTTTVTTTVTTEETTSVTTTTAEQTETYETTTTTPGIITYDTPTLSPTTVELEVGEVTDSEFDVKLNISPEINISGATIYVEYDSDLLEIISSEINEYDIGGIAVDSITDGKYTFTYMNTVGTDYNGTYSSLKFRIKDNTMTSTVIYVVVDSLEDINLLPISNVIKNGIVSNREAVVAEAETDPADFTQIIIEKSDEAISLEDLGISDVKDVTVSDGQIAIVEDGMLTTLAAGETDLIVTHSDGSVSYYTIVITDSSADDTSSEVLTVKKLDPPQNKDSKGLSIGIIIAVFAAIAAIIIEYILIMKPFEKAKRTRQTVYVQDIEDEEVDENPTDEEESETDENVEDDSAEETFEEETAEVTDENEEVEQTEADDENFDD